MGTFRLAGYQGIKDEALREGMQKNQLVFSI